MQRSLLTKLSKSRFKLNQLTFVGSGINEEPLCNKDFLASVSSFVLRLIPFRSGKRVSPCSITNFSCFVYCFPFPVVISAFCFGFLVVISASEMSVLSMLINTGNIVSLIL